MGLFLAKARYIILDDKTLQLKCGLCKCEFSGVRATSIQYVLLHEASDEHVCAVKCEIGQAVPCTGLKLSTDCKAAAAEQVETFRVWLLQGAPWHLASLQHSCYLGDDKCPVIRCMHCKDNPKLLEVGASPCCSACHSLACSPKFIAQAGDGSGFWVQDTHEFHMYIHCLILFDIVIIYEYLLNVDKFGEYLSYFVKFCDILFNIVFMCLLLFQVPMHFE